MLRHIGQFILSAFGWRLVGELPKFDKYMVVVAPHTSNWDFFIFVVVKMITGIKIVFIGKHTIFIGPIGRVLRKLGGVPVDRSGSHNVVDTIVAEFKRRDKMIFALSPEGTRSYLDHWKSGFYHIARNANVPVLAAFLDTSTKTIGWGPVFELSDDKDADLARLADFYKDKKGFRPEKYSRPVFRKSDRYH